MRIAYGTASDHSTDYTIMDSFSPEFSEYWLADRASAVGRFDGGPREDEPLSESQQDALAALADRVSAARSVM